MVSYGECVTVSDEEPLQVTSESRREKQACSDIETIVLDEEPSNVPSGNIDLTDAKSVARNYKAINNFATIYGENKLFAEFLLKCLDLEMSDGMLRIINKSLVKGYERTDKIYRNSMQFNKVLVKALNRLEKDPAHKFSHVKDMVETLKLHGAKKRVQLVTLETNLNKNGVNKKAQERKPVVIDLDDDPSVSSSDTINLDDSDAFAPELNEEEKENHSKQSSQPISEPSSQTNLLEPQIAVTVPPSDSQECLENGTEQDLITIQKIKSIEAKIEKCKKQIEECEQAEVTDDSGTSPYIKCDSYKREIVNLYKELCELVGEDPVKKRTVRFQVLEGHPPGPMRKLEQFINDNIGEDGNPLFPDFCDVVQCVMAANIEEKLEWDKKMVMKEANALFTQCGRALQKQRQRREYREQILTRVQCRPELLDQDPADDDPVLLARLEANRKVALKKENDLLERYSMLQNLPSHVLRPGPSIQQIDQNGLDNKNNNNNNKEEIKSKSPEDSEDSNFEHPVVQFASQEIGVQVSLEDTARDNLNQKEKQVVIDEKNKEVKITIKEEPMDIEGLLEQLGDKCTSKIFDIEDPHLVIEISSDESDNNYDVEMDDM